MEILHSCTKPAIWLLCGYSHLDVLFPLINELFAWKITNERHFVWDERHVVSYRRQLHRLFCVLFRLVSKNKNNNHKMNMNGWKCCYFHDFVMDMLIIEEWIHPIMLIVIGIFTYQESGKISCKNGGMRIIPATLICQLMHWRTLDLLQWIWLLRDLRHTYVM